MIQALTITNFALIEHAHLTFDTGYTVITGETGSGKSILLSALHLLLGERADYKVIGSISEKAVVEADIEIDQSKLSVFFSENEIDTQQPTIVRREITTQGRSRAFINDVPVSLNQLKTFSEQLISIHSQYNTLELKRKEFQIQTLDILAGTNQQQEQFSKLFDRYRTLQKEIEHYSNELAQQEKEKEYNDFQRVELEELQLEKTNFNDTEHLLNRLEHTHEIRAIQQDIVHNLSREQGVLDGIYSINQQLAQLAQLDPSHTDLHARMQSLVTELKDIEEDLVQTLGDEDNIDEEQLQQQRLTLLELIDKYNRALVKHKCRDQRELMTVYARFCDAATDSVVLAQRVAQLNDESSTLLNELEQHAELLHSNRLSAVKIIEGKIQALLSELKLPDTKLHFHIEKSDQLNQHGYSVVSILFSANKGFAPIAIEKAASGGELSRVMLALQQLISEKIQLPTIFFDEIDTGVSGDVAQKIGTLLRQMGSRMQLFAISHLPQVAAKATHHFKVEKHVLNEKMQTNIHPLHHEERIEEIARLMSGETINEAAKINAKALMA